MSIQEGLAVRVRVELSQSSYQRFHAWAQTIPRARESGKAKLRGGALDTTNAARAADAVLRCLDGRCVNANSGIRLTHPPSNCQRFGFGRAILVTRAANTATFSQLTGSEPDDA